jgi:hypothetical protein
LPPGCTSSFEVPVPSGWSGLTARLVGQQDRYPPCSQKSNKHNAKREIKVPCCTQCAATRCTKHHGGICHRQTRARSTMKPFRSCIIIAGNPRGRLFNHPRSWMLLRRRYS